MRITYALSLFITIFAISIGGFSENINAKPVHVAECLEENDPECEEASETSTNNNESTPVVIDDERTSGGSLFINIVKLVFALLFILALIYGLLAILRKRNRLFGQVKVMENLGGIPVGQNKSIQMIRVGSKVYMVGVGENVELLKEITDQELINEIFTNKENESQSTEFSIQSLLSKTKEQMSHKQTNSFKNMFQKELDELKQNRTKMKQMKQRKDHLE